MWKHIVLIGGGGMLPSSWSAVQPRALPESLTPTYQSPTPPCWPAIPVPPLSSYFLSVFLSLSLINVKPSNNKASILFLPAFSALHVCHCALTPPPPAQAATVILSHGRGAETPGPHCQHERFTGSMRRGQGKKVKRRHFSHFNLFFVWPQEKKRIPSSFT